MTIRVCLTSTGTRTLSCGKGAIDEKEFQKRIYEESNGKIKISFLLKKDDKLNLKGNDIVLIENYKRIPTILSYQIGCLRNLGFLLKQDIIVSPNIDINGLFVTLFCKLFRKKSMITIHGHHDKELELEHLSNLNLFIRQFYSRFTLKYANFFVPINEKIRDELIDKGVSPSKLLIRYVIVDTEKFDKKRINKNIFDEVKKMYNLPEKYILYVGHLVDRERGHNDALEVFKIVRNEMQNYKCVIIGKGPLKGELERSIENNCLKESVIQIDSVNHDLMPYIYYGADVLILPIYPPAAGVGKIRLEALSMELPAVINYVPAGYEVVIDGQTGYRVPAGDIGLMAAKVLLLLKNPDLKKRLGSNGRKLVRQSNDVSYYINNWVNSINYLYNL